MAQNRNEERRSFNPFRQIDWGESYTSLVLGLLIVIVGAFLIVTVVKNYRGVGPRQETSSDKTVNLPPTTQPTKPAAPTKPTAPTAPATSSAQSQPTTIVLPTSMQSAPTSLPGVVQILPTSPTEIAQQPAPTTSVPSSYTVVAGDTLWNISQKLYNSGYNWVDIAKANNIKTPNKIFVGQVLTIPNVAARFVTTSQTKGGMVQQVTPQRQIGGSVQKPALQPITGTSYTVVKGDTLWTIAQRAYGPGFRWAEIAKANNITNSRHLHSGNILIIPR
jgi:nucleoid-associated protein YgaU